MIPGSSRFPSRCWIQRVQEPGSSPVDTIANFARRILAAGGDLGGQRPTTIKEAPYLGRGIANGGLIPRDAFVTATRFEDWLG